MSKTDKPILCEIVAGMVSLFFWGQIGLYLTRIKSFKSMFSDMGGELPMITNLVMNHYVVATPLLISVALFIIAFHPTIRDNRLKHGILIGISLAISVITLSICTFGMFAPMFEMTNVVG